MKKLILSSFLTLASMAVFAQTQTVSLSVPSMHCVTCPYTVKRALQNVEGVSQAEATLETRIAKVTFDDKKTNTAALIKATTNAGYPSSVIK